MKNISVDFALGTTLIYLGEGEVEQTAQGVRFKGDFEIDIALFLGGTIRYDFLVKAFYQLAERVLNTARSALH